MSKDFKQWHEVKSELEDQENPVYFYEREVWFAALGLNLGHEEDGKNEKFVRPIIVIKKFNKDQFLGIPLTSAIKAYPHYYPLEINRRKSSALLHQIRSLDRKRLLQNIGVITESDFIQIRNNITNLLSVEKANPLAGRGCATSESTVEAEAQSNSIVAEPDGLSNFA